MSADAAQCLSGWPATPMSDGFSLPIERRDGSVIVECHHPRDAFAGHDWETQWNALHLTYFMGYAIWNYVSIPFLLKEPDFETRELDRHEENNEH